MATLMVFMSHIHEEERLAQLLKSRIEETFLEVIKVFVSSDAKSIKPGEDWFLKMIGAIREAHVLLILASSESATRPWINFEAGAGWLGNKRVVPLCHGGMIPTALPETLRRLQATDMTSPTKVQELFESLASEAGLPMPKNFQAEEIALKFKEGLTKVEAAEAIGPEERLDVDETLEAWRRRPGAHAGEEIVAEARLGEVRSPSLQMVKEAGLEPKTALRIVLHLHEEEYRPFYECMADGEVADTLDKTPEDSWGRFKLRLASAYEFIDTRTVAGGTIDATRFIPLIVVDEFVPTDAP